MDFADEPGGAFAFGLVKSVVLIWAYRPQDGAGRAYCYHAPLGALTPPMHASAMRHLGCVEHVLDSMYVVVASGRAITPEEEAAVLRFGVHPDRTFTYSNAWLSQFGVSNRGCVGEAG